MSVTRTPFTKTDLERFIYTDPALSTTERWVAVQILKTLDNRFQPVKSRLMSQALIGYRLNKWRESVNRAVRKLVILGYFHAAWVSVDRATRQGIKGVTRVLHELGPVLRKLVDNESSKPGVFAGKPRGVMSHHPSPAPPGSPGTVGGYVDAKSADRNSGALENRADFKRKTLEQWPRLAGPQRATPTPAPFGELAELERAAIARGDQLAGLGPDQSELTADEYAARLQDARRRASERNQPRRSPRRRR